MDYGAMLTESFEYAKEALLGKWVRWIIFIILGLPFALVKFTIDPEYHRGQGNGNISSRTYPLGAAPDPYRCRDSPWFLHCRLYGPGLPGHETSTGI